jgi:predicted TIM-barrel fold metal-dependent hydrolase
LRCGRYQIQQTPKQSHVYSINKLNLEILKPNMSSPLFPDGGWDVHHHIFERKTLFHLDPKQSGKFPIHPYNRELTLKLPASRFPYDTNRHLTPPPATIKQYTDFKSKIGLTNSVLTHGLSYGADSTCLHTFTQDLGPTTTRSIAVIDPETTTPAELANLHRNGVRGIRVNMYRYNAMHDVELQKLALTAHARALDGHCTGWSMAFTHTHPEFWAELKPVIEYEVVARGIRLVTDHFALLKGRSMLSESIGTGIQGDVDADVTKQPGFEDILDLVHKGHLFVKISAPYRVSTQAPHFEDLKPLVRALFDANPQQILWGSDWYVSVSVFWVQFGSLKQC